MTTTTIRAVVLSDSPAEVVALLEGDADITVVGQAAGAAAVIALVLDVRPDIVIVDLELGDGSAQRAIEQIMNKQPTPILVLSPPGRDAGNPSVVEALVAGALEAVPRPRHWSPDQSVELRQTVRRLSRTWVIRHLRGGPGVPARKADQRPPQAPLVAVAASTGGPTALAALLAEIGELAAPLLIVQHLHPDFIQGLFEWMSRVSVLPVEVARHHQVAEPGRVYLAPGGTHLRVGAGLRLELGSQPMTTHRPSATVLFSSMAEHLGRSGIGVILTGMGDDGAQGLLELRRSGGQTLAQDEASSAVFGMPRAAYRLGAVEELLPLSQLAAAIRRAVRITGRVGG